MDSTQAYGRHKYGFAVNADQYLAKDFGVFAKASYNDGHTQTWFFTEIDRSVTFGAVLKGTSWKRADDELGLAFIGNGLSADHKNYLAASRIWFFDPSGDGKLNYAPEMIAELYYKGKRLSKEVLALARLPVYPAPCLQRRSRPGKCVWYQSACGVLKSAQVFIIF